MENLGNLSFEGTLEQLTNGNTELGADTPQTAVDPVFQNAHTTTTANGQKACAAALPVTNGSKAKPRRWHGVIISGCGDD